MEFNKKLIQVYHFIQKLLGEDVRYQPYFDKEYALGFAEQIPQFQKLLERGDYRFSELIVKFLDIIINNSDYETEPDFDQIFMNVSQLFEHIKTIKYTVSEDDVEIASEDDMDEDAENHTDTKETQEYISDSESPVATENEEDDCEEEHTDNEPPIPIVPQYVQPIPVEKPSIKSTSKKKDKTLIKISPKAIAKAKSAKRKIETTSTIAALGDADIAVPSKKKKKTKTNKIDSLTSTIAVAVADSDEVGVPPLPSPSSIDKIVLDDGRVFIGLEYLKQNKIELPTTTTDPKDVTPITKSKKTKKPKKVQPTTTTAAQPETFSSPFSVTPTIPVPKKIGKSTKQKKQLKTAVNSSHINEKLNIKILEGQDYMKRLKAKEITSIEDIYINNPPMTDPCEHEFRTDEMRMASADEITTIGKKCIKCQRSYLMK